MYDSNETSVFLKPVFNLSETGKRIKSLMEERNIKPTKIKVLMGFPYVQTIYNWTRGVNAPTLDNLIVLSKILGVPINDIVVADIVEIEVENEFGRIKSA